MNISITEKYEVIAMKVRNYIKDSLTDFYEYVLLRTNPDYYWSYRSIGGFIEGVTLRSVNGRLVAQYTHNALFIEGDCKASFIVDKYTDVYKVQKFINKWLKREKNVNMYFDESFQLLEYDYCSYERKAAKNCNGIWQERDEFRWLEDLKGKVICQYDTKSCAFKYKDSSWNPIDVLDINFNSEDEFKRFIERNIRLKNSEVN